MLAVVICLAGCATALPEPVPGSTRSEVCRTTTDAEIAGLFDRWNRSLQTGDPKKVVANYAEHSVLLPTLSNTPRKTAEEQAAYFAHFLELKPVGTIDWRMIEIGCTTAVDTGLYTFALGANGTSVKARYTFHYRWDGRQWLITSHHSSGMPEKN